MDINIDILRTRLREKGLLEYVQFLETSVPADVLINYLDQCQPVITGIIDRTIIQCKNSYQRKIVHIIADAFDLDHARYGDWDPAYKHHFDWECRCRYCWEAAGKNYYSIRGVQISKTPIENKSRKDTIHRT